jgi:ATP-dependent Clp protease adaptor protein ClpS
MENTGIMSIHEPGIDLDAELMERLLMLPRYSVLLHNDDFHDMDHVVRALLCTIITMTLHDAVRIMLEAHTEGIAHIITCPRETAEFYFAELRRFGLEVTIEPR